MRSFNQHLNRREPQKNLWTWRYIRSYTSFNPQDSTKGSIIRMDSRLATLLFFPRRERLLCCIIARWKYYKRKAINWTKIKAQMYSDIIRVLLSRWISSPLHALLRRGIASRARIHYLSDRLLFLREQIQTHYDETRCEAQDEYP